MQRLARSYSVYSRCQCRQHAIVWRQCLRPSPLAMTSWAHGLLDPSGGTRANHGAMRRIGETMLARVLGGHGAQMLSRGAVDASGEDFELPLTAVSIAKGTLANHTIGTNLITCLEWVLPTSNLNWTRFSISTLGRKRAFRKQWTKRAFCACKPGVAWLTKSPMISSSCARKRARGRQFQTLLSLEEHRVAPFDDIGAPATAVHPDCSRWRLPPSVEDEVRSLYMYSCNRYAVGAHRRAR